MCDPVSASLALAGTATLAQTMAAYRQGQAQQSQLRAQAQMQERGAQSAIDNGRAQDASLRLQSSVMQGQQRAGLAAAGVDLGDNAAVNLLTDTNLAYDRDARAIRQDASTAAANNRAQASIYNQSAQNISPGTSAATGLLSSGSRFADRWVRYRNG